MFLVLWCDVDHEAETLTHKHELSTEARPKQLDAQDGLQSTWNTSSWY